MAIRLIAGIIAAVLTPPLIFVLLLLWMFPGWDFSISDIFSGLHRFFVRLFSGHALRPFTLYATSPSPARKSPASTTHVEPLAAANHWPQRRPPLLS